MQPSGHGGCCAVQQGARVFCLPGPTQGRRLPLPPLAWAFNGEANMTSFLVVLHILVCVFLILFVLLQPGARGGVGAAFGGAGGATVFGGRGANTFLAKLTAAAAVVFMMTSISLSYFGSSSMSVMDKRGKAAAAAADKPADKATDLPAASADGANKDAPAAPDAPQPVVDAPPAAPAVPAAPAAPAAPANPG